MSLLERFTSSDFSYADVAHVLGCCELTARNKINGRSRVTRAEQIVLDELFDGGEEEGCKKSAKNCMTEKLKR